MTNDGRGEAPTRPTGQGRGEASTRPTGHDADKAERTQALKAFLIPSGLFVACLFNAAGIYILYSGSTIGMIFLGIGLGIITAGLFAFITFQNKHRAGAKPRQNREPEPYMPPSYKRKKQPTEEELVR